MNNDRKILPVKSILTGDQNLAQSLYEQNLIFVYSGQLYFSELALAEVLPYSVRAVADWLKKTDIDVWSITDVSRRFYLESDVIKYLDERKRKKSC